MDFEAFEREARQVFEAIPPRYREGVDGLTVHRKPLGHPRFPGIFTLGECATEGYPSNWEGPETCGRCPTLLGRSSAAGMNPAFDWRADRGDSDHEIRHHLESLADRDDLGGVDYAMEQAFQRDRGLEFEPDYYRHGDRIGPGVYAAEDDVYIEQLWNPADFARAERIPFAWAGRNYEIGHPVELGDIHFIRIVEGIPGPPFLELVLVRRDSLWQRMRRVYGEPGWSCTSRMRWRWRASSSPAIQPIRMHILDTEFILPHAQDPGVRDLGGAKTRREHGAGSEPAVPVVYVPLVALQSLRHPDGSTAWHGLC